MKRIIFCLMILCSMSFSIMTKATSKNLFTTKTVVLTKGEATSNVTKFQGYELHSGSVDFNVEGEYSLVYRDILTGEKFTKKYVIVDNLKSDSFAYCENKKISLSTETSDNLSMTNVVNTNCASFVVVNNMISEDEYNYKLIEFNDQKILTNIKVNKNVRIEKIQIKDNKIIGLGIYRNTSDYSANMDIYYFVYNLDSKEFTFDTIEGNNKELVDDFYYESDVLTIIGRSSSNNGIFTNQSTLLQPFILNYNIASKTCEKLKYLDNKVLITSLIDDNNVVVLVNENSNNYVNTYNKFTLDLVKTKNIGITGMINQAKLNNTNEGIKLDILVYNFSVENYITIEYIIKDNLFIQSNKDPYTYNFRTKLDNYDSSELYKFKDDTLTKYYIKKHNKDICILNLPEIVDQIRLVNNNDCIYIEGDGSLTYLKNNTLEIVTFGKKQVNDLSNYTNTYEIYINGEKVIHNDIVINNQDEKNTYGAYDVTLFFNDYEIDLFLVNTTQVKLMTDIENDQIYDVGLKLFFNGKIILNGEIVSSGYTIENTGTHYIEVIGINNEITRYKIVTQNLSTPLHDTKPTNNKFKTLVEAHCNDNNAVVEYTKIKNVNTNITSHSEIMYFIVIIFSLVILKITRSRVLKYAKKN